jgi:hypothetical protein
MAPPCGRVLDGAPSPPHRRSGGGAQAPVKTSLVTQGPPPTPTNPHEPRPRESSAAHRHFRRVGAAITTGSDGNDGQKRCEGGDLGFGRRGAPESPEREATREGDGGTREERGLCLSNTRGLPEPCRTHGGAQLDRHYANVEDMVARMRWGSGVDPPLLLFYCTAVEPLIG